jgi:hypothetical protein
MYVQVGTLQELAKQDDLGDVVSKLREIASFALSAESLRYLQGSDCQFVTAHQVFAQRRSR